MKKLLLSAVCVVVAVTTNAQLSKGQKMIGGELLFSHIKNVNNSFFGETTTTVINISPQFGFGLSNNWIVGAGLGYGHGSEKNGSSGSYIKTTNNVYSFALFVRKFRPFIERAGVYGQLDAGGGFGKAEEKQVQGSSSMTTTKADITNVSALLRPGFYFKATKRIILEANFGGILYTSSRYKPQNDIKTTESEFRITLTSSLGLGFEFIF